jgi:hypothetical protein
MPDARAPRVVFWLVCLLAVITAGGCRDRRPEVRREQLIQATHDGDLIIQAVLDFRRDEERMPRSLEELVPRRLPAMPIPEFGTWVLRPASPGKPVDEEFAVVLLIDQERFKSDCWRIVCYVEARPRWQPEWLASVDQSVGSGSSHLRRTSISLAAEGEEEAGLGRAGGEDQKR